MNGDNKLLVIGFVVMYIILISSVVVVVNYANYEINKQYEERQTTIEEFKLLTCTEKQQYLLNNDYYDKQRDYYVIECGSSPIGDWGK